nr:hypothetical protein [Tanacetum cinerariifolium]
GINTAEELVSTAGASIPVSTAGMVDKGKAIMQESEPEQTTTKLQQRQEKAGYEAAEDIQATIEADEELALRIQAEEREKYFEAEKARLLIDLINQRKRYFAQQRTKERRNKPMTQAQQRTYMSNYVKHMVQTFTPIESDVDRTIPKIADESTKRVAEEEELEQENSKRQKTRESSEPREKEDDELTQEDLQQMMMMVSVEEVYKFDRDDLIKLWDLVKEMFSTTEPTDDKDKELWVELKRLFEPDTEDELWKLQRHMRDPLTWRLYDTCGVHHVSTEKGMDILMLIEKEYPLSKGLMTVMLVNKLLVDQYSKMENKLILSSFGMPIEPERALPSNSCSLHLALLLFLLLDCDLLFLPGHWSFRKRSNCRMAMETRLKLAFAVDSLDQVYELDSLGMLLLVSLRPYAWVSSVRYLKIGAIQVSPSSSTTASISTSLIDFSFSSSTNTCLLNPALEPSMQDDPSVNKIHGSGTSSSTSIRVSRESSSGRLTMKSANICPLTKTLGHPRTLRDFCQSVCGMLYPPDVDKKMENLNEVRVKELRSDNETEFRNHKLQEFCDEKVHVTFSEDDEAISQSSTEGDAINFNENRSFPDDEFLKPRSEVTQCPGNTEYFPYIPAHENTTPFESPILQEYVISEDPFEFTEANNHPALNEPGQTELADLLEPAEPQTNVIFEPINDVQPSPTISPSAEVILQTPVPQDRWSRENHIELVNIIGEPLAGITTRSRIRDLDVASAFECLYVNFLSKIKPKKLIKALEDEGWIISMQEERNQLKETRYGPWFQNLMGYSQQEGINYEETLAPVVRLKAIRIFLTYAAYMGFMVYKIDVNSALLNGKISEEVHVQQPPGFESTQMALTLQLTTMYVEYLKEFWFTSEVKEDTKTITFLLSWWDKPLSFTQDEFVSAIGLPICKDVVPLPLNETVKAGLATLGLLDKDKPTLSSTVLVNSSPLKMNNDLTLVKPHTITAASFQKALAYEVPLTSHMLKVAKLSEEPEQSLLPLSREVNADDIADKSLSRASVQPVIQSKATTDPKTKKKKIPPSSKPKSPYKVMAKLPKKQVVETQHAEVTVATADATKSLKASELAEEQGNQPSTTEAVKLTLKTLDFAGLTHPCMKVDLYQNIKEEKDAEFVAMDEIAEEQYLEIPTVKQLLDEADKLNKVVQETPESPYDTESEIKVVKSFFTCHIFELKDQTMRDFKETTNIHEVFDSDLQSIPDDELRSVSGFHTADSYNTHENEVSKSDHIFQDDNASAERLSLPDHMDHICKEVSSLYSRLRDIESSIVQQVSAEFKSSLPALVTDSLKEQLPSLLSDALKDTLPQLLKDSIKSSVSTSIIEELPHVKAQRFLLLRKELSKSLHKNMKKSIRLKVKKGMKEVRDKLSCCTSIVAINSQHVYDLMVMFKDMVSLLKVAEVFKKANAKGEKWEKNNPGEEKDAQHPNQTKGEKISGANIADIVQGEKPSAQVILSEEKALVVHNPKEKKERTISMEDDSDDDDLNKQPLSKRFKIMTLIPNPIPLNTFVLGNLLKAKEQQKSLHEFTEQLFGTTSSNFTPTPPREPTPPRDPDKGKEVSSVEEQVNELVTYQEEKGSIPKIPDLKSFITPEGTLSQEEHNNQIKELKRISDLKARIDKSEQELRKMFNQAILKARAKKWTEHEAKKAKILEEYNHHIYFRVDPLPITKISYIVNSNKEETMKIIREVMKGLSECKASKSNIRRILVKDIIKEVEDYLNTYSSAGMDISCGGGGGGDSGGDSGGDEISCGGHEKKREVEDYLKTYSLAGMDINWYVEGIRRGSKAGNSISPKGATKGDLSCLYQVRSL